VNDGAYCQGVESQCAMMQGAVNDSDDWFGFWIGQQPALCLWITYLSPEVPSDCHSFRAEAAAPGFQALFDFIARIGEFEAFRDQVKRMYETLQGTARFESIEGNVIVDATIDRLGHVFWKITLHSHTGGEMISPELTFSIEEDQTLLWNVAAKIEDMLECLSEGAETPRK
jgi:hypothetical protein